MMPQLRSSRNKWRSFLLISSILLFLLSPTATSSSTTTTITTDSSTSLTTNTTPTTSPQPSPNMLSQLGTYLRDSLIRLKDGTTQLYTNHKTCNEIRSKQSECLKLHEKRGITYSEFEFLQLGRDDRSKLGNILFLSVFSPSFLPYAFMFFPTMLPSPFASRLMDSREDLEMISRNRAHAVISAMVEIEKETAVVAKSPLSYLNPFGRGKAEKGRQRMKQVQNVATDLLLHEVDVGKNPKGKKLKIPKAIKPKSPTGEEERILETLKGQIYTSEIPSKDRTRLVIVPKPIVKSISSALENSPPGGFSFVPHFFTRNKVLTHLQKVTEADEFLVSEDIDLDTVEGDLLIQACNRRLIGTFEKTEGEMRDGLGKWLECMVVKPKQDEIEEDENLKKRKEAGVLVMRAGGEGNEGEEIEKRYYNGNLARVALMCYNAVKGVRDEKCSSTLPRLLYVGKE